MSESPKLEVKSVVVCDLVRREDNGKEILIGVYPAGVLVPQFPAQVVLTYWIHFKGIGAGNLSVEFQLVSADEAKFAELRANLNLKKPGYASMAIGPFAVNLQIPTSLRLQMKQGEQDWETIEEVAIEKGVVTNPLTGAPVHIPTQREYMSKAI
jgi:hypothetical protein